MEVNGDMTMGEMVEEIYNTTVSTTPKGKIVGTVTGSGTINIANTVKKFAELTSSNFLIVITQAPYTTAGEDNGGYCLADGFKPSLSYNPSNGVISIGGLNQLVHVKDKGGWNRVAATQNITANIIMI